MASQQLKAETDKDIYVTSRLDLQLPPQVDDLIPPSTRLSTRSALFTETPQWRTTLVYYLSRQILTRLRKRQTHVTLDIISLSEQCVQEHLGSVELNMQDAKIVLMNKGNRDITQIQQFVVDKGEWHAIHHPDHPVKGKIKAGLFFVEMPNNVENSAATNKEVGTPVQAPVRTKPNSFAASLRSQSTELGLEISTDVSKVFNQQEDSSLLDDDDDYLPLEDNTQQDLLDEEDEDDDYSSQIIAIGQGTDQYTFVFRILEAKYISSLLSQYNNEIEIACIQYRFANQIYQCNVDTQQDTWEALEYHKSVFLQGHLEDIKEWLSEQICIEVWLAVKPTSEEQDVIMGYSEVYLKDRDLGIIQQSSIIYDANKVWHINSKKQFAQLQLQIGLTEGWSEPELPELLK
ncbi:hypothetical protein CU098_008311 [Rhizopus stolonifer]|uniref:Uncharacterized protein n=1 Tax=Rhizopus stolonifer TaxID=4846 RepID=A0A367KBF1_RHIST|nr:hypothetical protein CU098_008311 [Rhizopus stolonifer]